MSEWMDVDIRHILHGEFYDQLKELQQTLSGHTHKQANVHFEICRQELCRNPKTLPNFKIKAN